MQNNKRKIFLMLCKKHQKAKKFREWVPIPEKFKALIENYSADISIIEMDCPECKAARRKAEDSILWRWGRWFLQKMSIKEAQF